jgi:hypothetical protein
MMAFRISINGKPFEPIDDVTTLTMVSEPAGRSPGDRVSLMVSGDSGDPIQALAAHLGPGDEVVIRVCPACLHACADLTQDSVR